MNRLILPDGLRITRLRGEGKDGFLDRDLYHILLQHQRRQGSCPANPHAKQLLGVDANTLKGAVRKAYGLELVAAEEKPDGQITGVSCMRVRPGPEETPVPKVSFATRVGDLNCLVGYYKSIVPDPSLDAVSRGSNTLPAQRGRSLAQSENEPQAGHPLGVLETLSQLRFIDRRRGVGEWGEAVGPT